MATYFGRLSDFTLIQFWWADGNETRVHFVWKSFTAWD